MSNPKFLSPSEAEASARSAKRQFAMLGLDSSHIDPAAARAAAEAAQKELAAPATKGDIARLLAEIGELSKMLLDRTRRTTINSQHFALAPGESLNIVGGRNVQ